MQAIKFNPNYAEIYFNRGSSYGELGDFKKATEDARKACDLGDCKLLQHMDENGYIRN